MKKKYKTASEFELIASDKIDEWIEKSMTFENGCKRKPTKEDFLYYESDVFEWIFTDKGEMLFRSYVSKVNRLGNSIFKDANIDVARLTSVIYP